MRLLDVELENPVHVLREVEHDRDVAALPGEARARAARQHRRVRTLGTPPRRHARRLIVFRAPRGRSASGGSWRRRWRTARGCRGRSGLRRGRSAEAPVRARRPGQTCRPALRGSSGGRGRHRAAGRRFGFLRRSCQRLQRGKHSAWRCGTPASASPISTPLSVPASIRSLNAPR